jgi:hypothetical protein
MSDSPVLRAMRHRLEQLRNPDAVVLLSAREIRLAVAGFAPSSRSASRPGGVEVLGRTTETAESGKFT